MANAPKIKVECELDGDGICRATLTLDGTATTACIAAMLGTLAQTVDTAAGEYIKSLSPESGVMFGLIYLGQSGREPDEQSSRLATKPLLREGGAAWNPGTP